MMSLNIFYYFQKPKLTSKPKLVAKVRPSLIQTHIEPFAEDWEVGKTKPDYIDILSYTNINPKAPLYLEESNDTDSKVEEIDKIPENSIGSNVSECDSDESLPSLNNDEDYLEDDISDIGSINSSTEPNTPEDLIVLPTENLSETASEEPKMDYEGYEHHEHHENHDQQPVNEPEVKKEPTTLQGMTNIEVV